MPALTEEPEKELPFVSVAIEGVFILQGWMVLPDCCDTSYVGNKPDNEEERQWGVDERRRAEIGDLRISRTL